jgi:sugar phosphate isomerase/epimerase
MRGTFRLGTTSYIIDGGLADNLLWLASRPGPCRIGEMQLVLFETPEISNIPSPEEASLLAKIASDRGMVFTVHLPCGINLGDADPSARRASAGMFARVVEVTSKLDPICWVLHIPMPDESETDGYLDRTRETLASLIGGLSSPRELAIENIHPVFELEPPIIEEFDTSVCIDAGHLAFFGSDVRGFLDRWLPRCRNVHVHGSTGERDHDSLACLPREFLRRLFERLSDAPCLRTVTMEVFGVSDFESSIEAVRRTGYVLPQNKKESIDLYIDILQPLFEGG